MRRFLFTATIVVWASGVVAQHAPMSSEPTEAGQAQFAAIAEITSLLRADPKSDWNFFDWSAGKLRLGFMYKTLDRMSDEKHGAVKDDTAWFFEVIEKNEKI